MILKITFWVLLAIIAYTYLGYTLVLFIANLFIRPRRKKTAIPETGEELPDISLIIPAYNEMNVIDRKIKNINSLEYPANKIDVIWLTDGSDDGSYEYLKEKTNHKVLHQTQRLGKSQAVNKAMKEVSTDLAILTDANTILNTESLNHIVAEFSDSKTGCVSGEKRIMPALTGNAVCAGEGIYWRYESFIKKLESDLNTAIGGAGELLGLRSNLFREIPADIINDDFYISVMIIKQGYRISYCPGAFALEKPSLNTKEEKKRKVRIASGGMQIFIRHPDLLNIFKYGFYSFQYFSHKVLRWTIVPALFFAIPVINLLIIVNNGIGNDWYSAILFIQALFFLLAILGAFIRSSSISFKTLFLPYYLTLMNISNLKGAWQYIRGNYDTKWEKSDRMI
ncbi:MAG: glycosyltransferase family 2 protein [Bacteroidales bacterium]|nr:glycosyltransferase family 2 protein [Bacteroidales bacterium]